MAFEAGPLIGFGSVSPFPGFVLARLARSACILSGLLAENSNDLDLLIFEVGAGLNLTTRPCNIFFRS